MVRIDELAIRIGQPEDSIWRACQTPGRGPQPDVPGGGVRRLALLPPCADEERRVRSHRWLCHAAGLSADTDLLPSEAAWARPFIDGVGCLNRNVPLRCIVRFVSSDDTRASCQCLHETVIYAPDATNAAAAAAETEDSSRCREPSAEPPFLNK